MAGKNLCVFLKPFAESKTLEACKPDSQGCDVSSDESDTSDEPDLGNLRLRL